MSLQLEERDHLVSGLAWWRRCRRTVITPRLASIQMLFLKVVLFQAGISTSLGVVLRGS